jgi:carbon storage regulator
MLVLSRKLNEKIVIDGRITVQVLRLTGSMAKLGILAPPEVMVHRQEIHDEIQQNNREAVTSGKQSTAKIPKVLAPPGRKRRLAAPNPHRCPNTNP